MAGLQHSQLIASESYDEKTMFRLAIGPPNASVEQSAE
jgi:hypothetical protein